MRRKQYCTYHFAHNTLVRKKRHAFRVLLNALILLLLLILPLLYQKTVKASGATNQGQTVGETAQPESEQTKESTNTKADAESEQTKESTNTNTEADSNEQSQADSSQNDNINNAENYAVEKNVGENDNTYNGNVESDATTDHGQIDDYIYHSYEMSEPPSSIIDTMIGQVLGNINQGTESIIGNLKEAHQNELSFCETDLYKKFIPKVLLQISDDRYDLVSITDSVITIKSQVKETDFISTILGDWVSHSVIVALVDQTKDIHRIDSIRPGRNFYISYNTKTKKIAQYKYEYNNSNILVVDFEENSPKISEEAILYDYELALISGEIQDNLFLSAIRAGGEGMFAIDLANIFRFDIDFVTDVRKGDSFIALVEKRYKDGVRNGYGRIIAATFVNKGKPYDAYLFHETENNEKVSYYNKKAEPLQKAFLKVPVAFTRVSSRYTLNRMHPILKYVRPHQGIDYAAPHGTPVISVADGTISRSAYTGGYGHFVKIRHTGGLESQYAHLSRYGKGIKRGAKVSQGQVIGYVGSSGLSTGPHLDFRIKKNGKFVNPDTLIVPNKLPLKEESLPAYQELMEHLDAYMTAKKPLTEYDANTWLQGIR